MRVEKQLEEEKRRRDKINSLEGMIKKGKPPQAEQAKKALFKLQKELEEGEKTEKKGG